MKTTPSILSLLACSSLLLVGVEARGALGGKFKLIQGDDNNVVVQQAEHVEDGPDNARDVGSKLPPAGNGKGNDFVISHGAANNPTKGKDSNNKNDLPMRGAIDLSNNNNNIPQKKTGGGGTEEGGEGEGEKVESTEEEKEEEETSVEEQPEEQPEPHRGGILGALGDLGNLFNIAAGANTGAANGGAAKPAPPKEEKEEEKEEEEEEEEEGDEKEEEETEEAAGAPVKAGKEFHLPFYCDFEMDFFNNTGHNPSDEELTDALKKLNEFLNALIVDNPTFEFHENMEKPESIMNNMGDPTRVIYDEEAKDHYYVEFDSVVDITGEPKYMKEIRDIVAEIVNHADFTLLITQFLWQLKTTQFYNTQHVILGCTYGKRPKKEETRLLRRRLLEESSTIGAFGGSHKVADAAQASRTL